MIRLTLQTGDTVRIFAILTTHLGDLSPVMAQARDLLLRSVRENFAQGGRPSWRPRRPPRQGTPLGGVSSRLVNSITSTTTPTSVTLTSSLPYSAIQQYGGTVHLPAMVAAPHRAFRFVTADNTVVFTKRVRAHSVTIPARPYLVAQPEDERELVRLTERHLGQSVETAR